MGVLDEFFNSEANQKKYGFECRSDSSGLSSIYYDGDVDELIDIAFESMGYKTISEKPADGQPELILMYSRESGLLLKEETVIVDVDGIGDEPNFFLLFSDNGKETMIRFNMTVPEIYPDNESLTYHLPLPSLTAINEMYRARYEELVMKWNTLRPDKPIYPRTLPNYRAINRVC